MADPVLITCQEGQWNLVAENVASGFIRQTLDGGSFQYFWTSRDTGGTAPSNSDKTDGGKALPLFEKDRNEEISSKLAQDFYVWVENPDSDELDSVDVRVDL